MLSVAASRRDVEWIQATAASIPFEREFALAVMTGHAFQVLAGDDELRSSLRAIRRALIDDGRFAFETRNPPARAWNRWDGLEREVVDPDGRALLVRYGVESVEDGVVTLTETTASRDGVVLRVDRGNLRFLDAEMLDRLLTETGFSIDARYGSWRGEAFVASSGEIVTVARAIRLNDPR